MRIWVTPKIQFQTLIRITATTIQQKDGETLFSGTWITLHPEYQVAYTSLGNRAYSGPFRSKVLPRRICTSQEEVWADRCDLTEVSNKYLFFLDPSNGNKPFLFLKGFNPLLMPSRGVGTLMRDLGDVVVHAGAFAGMLAGMPTEWDTDIHLGADLFNSVTWDASIREDNWKEIE